MKHIKTSKEQKRLKRLLHQGRELIVFDMGIGQIEFFQPENLTLQMKIENFLILQGGRKIYE